MNIAEARATINELDDLATLDRLKAISDVIFLNYESFAYEFTGGAGKVDSFFMSSMMCRIGLIRGCHHTEIDIPTNKVLAWVRRFEL